MPGITDSHNEKLPNLSNDNQKSSETEENNEIQAQEPHNNEESNGREEPVEQPYEPPENVRELTQTDKLNRHLLRSFLEHINSQNIQINGNDMDVDADEDSAEW